MRQWSIVRSTQPKFTEGAELVSMIFLREGKIVREDRLAAEVDIAALPPEVLGWWKSVVRKRPPTQRELNERLERLFLTLKESTAAHKEALQWLVGLYLTRKRILRQEPGAFTHVKTSERFEVKADDLTPEQMAAAMGELMGVIE